MHNLRSPRNNLTKREGAALHRLSNNTDIIIKPADKGGATVIMNTKDYVKEAKRQLDNEVYYKRVGRDLTHETGNGNTGYPSCFQNGLTCFCHVSVYGFLQFCPVKG